MAVSAVPFYSFVCYYRVNIVELISKWSKWSKWSKIVYYIINI
jgi:hypothetical protein